jgi:hypothetical protein
LDYFLQASTQSRSKKMNRILPLTVVFFTLSVAYSLGQESDDSSQGGPVVSQADEGNEQNSMACDPNNDPCVTTAGKDARATMPTGPQTSHQFPEPTESPIESDTTVILQEPDSGSSDE